MLQISSSKTLSSLLLCFCISATFTAVSANPMLSSIWYIVDSCGLTAVFPESCPLGLFRWCALVCTGGVWRALVPYSGVWLCDMGVWRSSLRICAAIDAFPRRCGEGERRLSVWRERIESSGMNGSWSSLSAAHCSRSGIKAERFSSLPLILVFVLLHCATKFQPAAVSTGQTILLVRKKCSESQEHYCGSDIIQINAWDPRAEV